MEVSSPSPSPTYMRLIWNQAAWVSDTEAEEIWCTNILEQRNARVTQKGPCRACVSHGVAYVLEDGKELCDTCCRWKVTCNLSRWKPHGAKVKCKGRSIIDLDEVAEGEPEAKCQKVNTVPVVEIQQPGSLLLALFHDLISVLWEPVAEQWKQTRLLA